jgi:predicted membrane-bound mannosyltransferase
LLIKVISEEYWPLPWYLRQFESVGYWNEMTDDPDASVIIVSAKLQAVLEAKISRAYQVEYRGLRPGVILLIYTEEKLWSRYIEKIDGNS